VLPAAVTARQYEQFQLIANGPALFNAMVTGIELGLFTFLSRSPGASAAELEKHTGLAAHPLRVLLLGLCAGGLLERRAGGYHNGPAAEHFLATDAPDGWAPILLGWKEIYYPAFQHMTEALRAGTNTALRDYEGDEPTLYQRLAHQPDLEAVLHRSMAAFTRGSLPGLLDDERIGAVRHLLDVGGGDGTTSRALAERYPRLTTTIFDLPSVVGLAAAQTPAELAGRVRVHGGDLFTDPFPPGADAVLFSHVLEVFSAEQIVVLLTKAYEALPAGGRAFLYGFSVPDEEDSGMLAARLSLYLNILATGQGMSYPAKDYAAWLRQAGFTRVEVVTGLVYEHGLIIGTKA
jgi:SAM-dependent methyltransferase